MLEVKKERTGWRDEELSRRHRMWGWDCPAVDIDFLLLEYDKGIPCALVEYKNEHAAPQYPSHPSYKALAFLSTHSNIPFFAVRYSTDFSNFKVIPLNDIANNIIKDRPTLTEKEYVTFLYKLRGRSVPSEVLENIGVGAKR